MEQLVLAHSLLVFDNHLNHPKMLFRLYLHQVVLLCQKDLRLRASHQFSKLDVDLSQVNVSRTVKNVHDTVIIAEVRHQVGL